MKMEHPQTLAKKLYEQFPNEKLKAISDYACCIFTLMWYLDINVTDAEAILLVSKLMNKKALDEECTVFWADCIRELTGLQLESVEKVSAPTLKKIKEKSIVRMKKGSNGHWVGVKNGKIVFNSLEYSVCASEGVPDTMRILKIKGTK